MGTITGDASELGPFWDSELDPRVFDSLLGKLELWFSEKRRAGSRETLAFLIRTGGASFDSGFSLMDFFPNLAELLIIFFWIHNILNPLKDFSSHRSATNFTMTLHKAVRSVTEIRGPE